MTSQKKWFQWAEGSSGSGVGVSSLWRMAVGMGAPAWQRGCGWARLACDSSPWAAPKSTGFLHLPHSALILWSQVWGNLQKEGAWMGYAQPCCSA